MTVPRWAGSSFSLGTTRCRILWFRVLLGAGSIALACACAAWHSSSEDTLDAASAELRLAVTAAGEVCEVCEGCEVCETCELVLEFYDVSDIVCGSVAYPAPAHPAPGLDVATTSAASSELVLELDNDEESAFWVDEHKLLDLVEVRAGLTGEHGHGSVEISADILIVRAPLGGHAKVRRMLDALRRT